jgi:hypothetical protein
MDMLLDATLPLHLSLTRSYALDGTAISSWGKGKFRAVIDPEADHAPVAEEGESTSLIKGEYSFDTDAEWGYQTRTYDNGSSKVHGYHAFALVGLPPVGADPDSWPKLVERIALAPANANATAPAMALIDSLIAAGRPINELISDREFTYKKPETWAIPLRDRNISQVIDLHPNDRGIRDYNGVAMIDGTPHCSAVLAGREPLIDIKRPMHLSPGELKANATEEEKREYQIRVEDLEKYYGNISARELAAFRQVSSPDKNGDSRWECPAQAGKVKCENCPLSAFLPEGTPVVKKPHLVPELPESPAKLVGKTTAVERAEYSADKKAWNAQGDYLRCCRQRTITIPGTVSAKLRQKHYWGSKAWVESYSRRTHIEGINADLKSAKTTHVTRGWHFLVGIVKNSLMLTCVAVASNIRRLRKWAQRTGDYTHRMSRPLEVGHGFEEIDSEGNPDLAQAPPISA